MWWIVHGANVECAQQGTLMRWLIPIQLCDRWCLEYWSGCVLSLVNLNLGMPQSWEVDPICKDHPRSRGKWWCSWFSCMIDSCLLCLSHAMRHAACLQLACSLPCLAKTTDIGFSDECNPSQIYLWHIWLKPSSHVKEGTVCKLPALTWHASIGCTHHSTNVQMITLMKPLNRIGGGVRSNGKSF